MISLKPKQMMSLGFFLEKVSTLVFVWVTARLLSIEDFGRLAGYQSLFAIFFVFAGLGFPLGLLRFGSRIPLPLQKKQHQRLASTVLYSGGLAQIGLMFLFILVSFLWLPVSEWTWWMLAAFSIRMLSGYLQLVADSFLRSKHEERSFAFSKWISSLTYLIIGLGLVWLFGFKGYLIGIALLPMISIFWLRIPYLKNASSFRLSKSFWKFSGTAAVNALVSGALYSFDILLITSIAGPADAGIYKVMILIPFNSLMFSVAIAQADYGELAKRASDHVFLKNYLKNYYKKALPIAIAGGAGMYVLLPWLISFIFGEKYAGYTDISRILWIGFLVAGLFRIPLSNILSAMGRMGLVLKISLATLAVLGSLGYGWMQTHGLYGMAWAMTLTLITSSLMYVAGMYFCLKKPSYENP